MKSIVCKDSKLWRDGGTAYFIFLTQLNHKIFLGQDFQISLGIEKKGLFSHAVYVNVRFLLKIWVDSSCLVCK